MRRLVTFFLVIPLLGAVAAPVAAQEPTTTEDLLAGMVTEVVEPGAYKVLSDGVRDFPLEGDVVAGQDGSLWLVHGEEGFVRLGSPESYTFPEGWDNRFVVAPDGTVWVSATRDGSAEGANWITRIHSLEDRSWTVRAEAPDLDRWTIASDGTVWAAYRTEGGSVVARLGADGWEPLEDPPSRRGLVVTGSGEVWVGTWLGQYIHRHDDGEWPLHEGGSLWRYHEGDGAWHEVTTDVVVHAPGNEGVAVGPDGTVWFADYEPLIVDGKPVPDRGRDADIDIPKRGDPFLMRFDGTEWQRWGSADGLPSLGDEIWAITLMPTPDGGLWLAENPFQCSEDWAVAHFDVDGSTWRHFLSDRCMSIADGARGHEADMALAPDGAVWLGTTPDPEDEDELRDLRDLYVITPEAVGASE